MVIQWNASFTNDTISNITTNDQHISFLGKEMFEIGDVNSRMYFNGIYIVALEKYFLCILI